MTHLRLTPPDIDFGIDVRVREFDGRWLAVADLADVPEPGTGATVDQALGGALAPFDRRLRDDLTRSVIAALACAVPW